MRMIPVMILVSLLFGPVPPSLAAEGGDSATEEAPPLTEAEAVAAVRAAFEAGDEARMAELAAVDEPDPWLVAETLCADGAHDAALAFAEAAPRKTSEALPGYVRSRRETPTPKTAREALAKFERTFASRDAPGALAATGEGRDAPGKDVTSIALRYGRGSVLVAIDRLDGASEDFAAAAAAAAEIGWSVRASLAWQWAGRVAFWTGDFREALRVWTKRQDVCERAGDAVGVAEAFGDMGIAYRNLGELDRAAEVQEKALRVFEGLGDRASVAATLINIGVIHEHRGDYTRALEYQERGLAEATAVGHRQWMANALGNIGNLHMRVGDYPRSLEVQERSLQIEEALGNREGVAFSLGNIALVLESLADYPRALDFHERALEAFEALGARAAAARALGSIGSIRMRLGDEEQALADQKRALARMEEAGDRAGVAATLGNIASLHQRRGEHTKALELQEQALRIIEKVGNRNAVAIYRGNMGNSWYHLGDFEKARRHQEMALKEQVALGDRAGEARTLGNLGKALRALGDFEGAIERQEQSLALARELGVVEVEVLAHANTGGARRAMEQPAAAVASLRLAVERLGSLVDGLGERQGARARSGWAWIFEEGVLAGRDRGDTGDVAFFIESGRAGALLEMLSLRERLGSVVIPPELEADLAASRRAEAGARDRLQTARDRRDIEAIKAERAALAAARQKQAAVVERIQRSAIAAASVVYPVADDLPVIRSRLTETEALVLYTETHEGALALVVTAKDARLVDLGPLEDLSAACAALDLENRPDEVDPAVAALRTLVVEPLGLAAGVKRVLVSPEGPLSYVPFVLLFPDREVAYLPSATTHGVLRADAGERGEGVLALGDPVYGKERQSSVTARLRSGRRLDPLPGTRIEAKAVGTVTLLGKQATEAGLREALGTRPRWRAVHLACHGLLDAEQPMFSSLALTPDGDDDGFLTVLEVFRMRVPADVVVLSACETGKGAVVRGEGIVGLTRAFMFAGAPRVLVSLWKVDDEATRALMVKFHELWSPGNDDAERRGAAAALREAQAFVAGHEQWRHPRYWAAWSLWGLAD